MELFDASIDLLHAYVLLSYASANCRLAYMLLHRGICTFGALFTVGALDSIDHNPSSTTSVDSFHGTGISLFQFPSRDCPGESRQHLPIPPSGNKQSLPDYYACVPAVSMTTSAIVIPSSVYSEAEPSRACLDEALVEEITWFNHALPLVEEKVVTKNAIAWAAGLLTMLHVSLRL